ncbi:MAG: ISL3 family transposase [Actinomycetota bacterium]|nr:ISL3 family transposase [Actinomycetota bacterium]
METDPTRMCELLVDLLDVDIKGVQGTHRGRVTIHFECRREVVGCPECGVLARVKDRRAVSLVDLPMNGRPTRVVWHKRRFFCPDVGCSKGSWNEVDTRIAFPRLLVTDRAGRWLTKQIGKYGRSVTEIAEELGCDWHTVNDTLLRYGEALVDDDTERVGLVKALGLDETLFVREGPYHRQHFSTQIVDVEHGQLLDVVPGRDSKGATKWIQERTCDWRFHVAYVTLDLSGPYRKVFNDTLPWATQIADPFHVIKLANSKLDECRRRVQTKLFGHRGRKLDPLYRARRLLTMAAERLDEKSHEKVLGLLRAGDPRGEVTACYNAKEAVRELYAVPDHQLAGVFIDELIRDMNNPSWPVEVRSLGRTLKRWRDQIIAWHQAHFSNGPTEGVNNLLKRVKRGAFGFRRFRNYRIRVLLYAGKPNWDLLTTITPR